VNIQCTSNHRAGNDLFGVICKNPPSQNIANIKTGKDCGKVLIITRALYGLKSSEAAWRAKLAETLMSLGFKSSRADPDAWLREHKYTNCPETYYELILVYVDNVLAISESPHPNFTSSRKGALDRQCGTLGRTSVNTH